MNDMTPEQALVIIRQACASVMADLASHQRIQLAIATVEGMIAQQPPTESPTPPVDQPKEG